MAGTAIKLHRTVIRKSFSLQRHAGMAGNTGLLFRLQSLTVVLGRELMTRRAVKCFHATDIGSGLCVTGNAFFGCWLHRV
jgi:hypothetical protein